MNCEIYEVKSSNVRNHTDLVETYVSGSKSVTNRALLLAATVKPTVVLLPAYLNV